MTIKTVHLNERIWFELFRYGMADTYTYRYSLFDGTDSCKVKRIRREYVGTNACLSDASDNNPNGWEEIKLTHT